MSTNTDQRPQNKGQLSKDLPGTTTYITGHDDKGKAIVHSTRPAEWQEFGPEMAFSLVYTNEFPVQMTGDADLKAHDERISSGTLGLVNPNGTVCRMVDMAPGYETIFHRTQSLDFGVVLEGSVEMVLDHGVKQIMHRGDSAVQRGTIHAWKNPSTTSWTRMLFVLQDCKPVEVAGKVLKEDLAGGVEGLPDSGNDSRL